MARPPTRPRGAVVFFHAHPDDEAIFTGGTMARLADDGWPVVLVLATGGELGTRFAAGRDADGLREERQAETRRAAEALGVSRLEFLGYLDSGVAGVEANLAPGSFNAADADDAAGRLAAICADVGAAALVAYDDHGIYGHPDHLKVHEVGLRAAARAGIEVVYEATVDREYLHFVETHLVVEVLGDAPEFGLASTSLGVPTVEVATTVDVRPVLDRKRAAMAAHASQIPESGYAMRLAPAAFSAVYGFEWYLRRGPAGPIDVLT
ncbi:MAG TPA: PIG-L family deacetylase [Acidimicrobiales bacterium]|nr:PIG-L family deacetylase [Acidimicrobiales bacterium]